MRLRRSAVDRPGLRRVRRGRGFGYLDDSGDTVTDSTTLQRIEDLVIPPAWRKVWICPYPNGHIQAVGTDGAGRRQYIYHSQWQEDRGEEKFDRVLELSAALVDWRAEIAGDLRRRGLTRDRVLALGLRLLDLGYFRAGGDQYAEENNSFGIATLLRDHVVLRSDAVEFDYPAKSGVRRTLEVEDPAVIRAVRSLQRSRSNGDRLLAFRDSSEWAEVHAEDLNVRFKEMVGDDYTVKDLRTWHGTVLAAEAFVEADPPADEKVIKRVESAVMREVAEALGNTAAVTRSAYVDPRVVEAYRDRRTIAAGARRAARARNRDKRQAILEGSTARLIRKACRTT
ncbi:DNA topoisomerase IB [Mycolicibacterium septicum DSM 44393]|uniref:DNA topoisomerase n=1 Tax=Mycolicibacterium septicum DSM 44393 TaxID=1341646 RepID=A0A7X6RXB8_9MYCO|nr:DNA topoisomerase IB [Mycolicibacterium septicum]NKZ13268.1 DNA topoisomerase IB [Mycolicibacterium septicum DSM 44393]